MPAIAVARAAPPLEVVEVVWLATRSPLPEVDALDSEAEDDEPLEVAVVMVESVAVIEAADEDEALSEADEAEADAEADEAEADAEVEPRR